jgi:hypothetical protein
LSSDNPTAKPPVGAGPLRVTEQAAVPGAATTAGVQNTLLNVTAGWTCGIVIVPPVPDAGIELPEAFEPITLLMVTTALELSVPGEMPKAIVAT